MGAICFELLPCFFIQCRFGEAKNNTLLQIRDIEIGFYDKYNESNGNRLCLFPKKLTGEREK